jgi:hypothetical protein
MKAHLVSSPQPVLDNVAETIVGVCGVLLEDPEIVMVWDGQVIGSEPMLSRVNFCGRCIEKAHEEHLVKTERRYLYGVVKGQME